MDRPNIISCPNCGAGNKAGSTVCRMCATPLDQPGPASYAQEDSAASRSADQLETKQGMEPQKIYCPDCNAENELGWAFCQQCGHRLPQKPPPPPVPPVIEQPIEQGIKTAPNEQPAKEAQERSFKTVEDEAPIKAQTKTPTSTSAATVIAEPPPPPKPAKPPEAPPKPLEAKPPAPQPPAPKPVSPRTEQVKSSSGSLKPGSGLPCPQCHHLNEPGNAFCSNCGAVLTVAQTMVMSSVVAPAKGKLHLVMEGGQQGEVFDLGDVTVVGRTQGDITFPHDGFMSGRHARIERRAASFILVDEGSRNGTFIKINGEVELKPGDMVLIGKQLFRFEEE
jgi:FHA domain/Double zinc ribbon